jgi:hypothetical protein
MSEYVRIEDGEFEVDFFEHTGNVELSALKLRFEGEVVTHERVTIEADEEWERFRSAAVTAKGNGQRYAVQAEPVDDG